MAQIAIKAENEIETRSRIVKNRLKSHENCIVLKVDTHMGDVDYISPFGFHFELDKKKYAENKKILRRQKVTKWLALLAMYHHKFGIRHLLLVLMLTSYVVIGGAIFNALEAPYELEELKDTLLDMNQIIGEEVEDVINITLTYNGTAREKRLRTTLKRYYKTLLEVEGRFQGSAWHKAENLDMHLMWYFSSAMFYCMTLFTTIGYGTIAPQTPWGRALSVIYACVGIPLMLVVLGDIGEWFQKFLTKGYVFCLGKYRQVRKLPPIEEPEEVLLPMWLALLLVVVYIVSCAMFIRLFDHNEGHRPGIGFGDAFYFTFISLTTIGLGDLMPYNIEYSPFLALAFLLGLALVSIVNTSIFAHLFDSYHGGVDHVENRLDAIHNHRETIYGHKAFQDLLPCFRLLVCSFPHLGATAREVLMEEVGGKPAKKKKAVRIFEEPERETRTESISEDKKKKASGGGRRRAPSLGIMGGRDLEKFMRPKEKKVGVDKYAVNRRSTEDIVDPVHPSASDTKITFSNWQHDDESEEEEEERQGTSNRRGTTSTRVETDSDDDSSGRDSRKFRSSTDSEKSNSYRKRVGTGAQRPVRKGTLQRRQPSFDVDSDGSDEKNDFSRNIRRSSIPSRHQSTKDQGVETVETRRNTEDSNASVPITTFQRKGTGTKRQNATRGRASTGQLRFTVDPSDDETDEEVEETRPRARSHRLSTHDSTYVPQNASRGRASTGQLRFTVYPSDDEVDEENATRGRANTGQLRFTVDPTDDEDDEEVEETRPRARSHRLSTHDSTYVPQNASRGRASTGQLRFTVDPSDDEVDEENASRGRASTGQLRFTVDPSDDEVDEENATRGRANTGQLRFTVDPTDDEDDEEVEETRPRTRSHRLSTQDSTYVPQETRARARSVRLSTHNSAYIPEVRNRVSTNVSDLTGDNVEQRSRATTVFSDVSAGALEFMDGVEYIREDHLLQPTTNAENNGSNSNEVRIDIERVNEEDEEMEEKLEEPKIQ